MNQGTKLVKREDEPGEIDRRFDDAANYRGGVYGYGPEGSEGEVHLLDYWRAIRKRLWLVLGVAALITALSTIYVARKADGYEASSQVQVDLENNPMYAGKSVPMIYSPVNDPAYFNTQLQILTSPGLLRRVLKTLELEHDQAFLRPQTLRQRSTWKTILQMWGVSGPEKKDPSTQPKELPLTSTVTAMTSNDDLAEARRLAPFVGALQVGLKVEPVRESRAGYYKETRLIDITYQHGDPEIAAKVTNWIAETFVHANLEKRNETNSTASEFLSKRVAELQAQIRSDDEKLVNYAKEHQILSLTDNQNVVVERLAGLNKALLEAENDRKIAEAELNAAKAPGAASALADAASKESSQTEAKLADLKQERAKLLVDATEK